MILTRHIVRLARAPYALRIASGARYYNPGQKGDTFDQAHQQGFAARHPEKATPFDAASPEEGKQTARRDLTGNRENIGFADQVESQSTTANYISGNNVGRPESAEGVTGQDDTTPPAFADVIKQKLGFKTASGEDKQNRGGWKGLTGTGQVALDRGKRTMHTSAMCMMDAQTKGQAPEASRQPKERTNPEQNAHLKHKSSKSQPDSGKGNASENPSLPSHHVDASWKPQAYSSSQHQQRHGFSTSVRCCAQDDAPETEHTAESYFKEVGDTKPTNPKVHQVDGSATGAPVMRANEQPATGEFSRSGAQSGEYETVSKQDQPYDTPPTRGPEADQKLRYGGGPGLNKQSGPEEGPTGQSKEGRKPEGRE